MGQNTSKLDKILRSTKEESVEIQNIPEQLVCKNLQYLQNQEQVLNRNPDTYKKTRMQKINITQLISRCKTQEDKERNANWKKANQVQQWGGGAPQYVVLRDGRKRRVILTNRKKYVKVKGEHVPLKIAQTMFR